MSAEDEKLEQYYKWTEKAQSGDYSVRIFKPDGQTEVGGNELLPKEKSFSFGDLKDRLADLKQQEGVFRVIFDDDEMKIPIAIEIGREGEARGEQSYFSSSSLTKKENRRKINTLIDVNIIPLLIAGGDNYVQCEIERLSIIFADGHRGNLMYLGQVLTNDGKAVDLSTPEKKQHIIQEIYKSMMPDGVVVIWNQDDDLEPSDFENNGFEILLNISGTFVLRKI